MKKYNKVYLKFTFINMLQNSCLILPIRVIYMISFGLTDTGIGLLKAVFSIIVTLAEIPTGAISDRISRKLSMLIANALFILHIIIYLVLPNFLGFVLTQVLLGLSSAFSSGSGSAYLHDYIDKETDDDYLEISGNMNFKIQIYASIVSILAGIIFFYNPKLNFIILGFFSILSFFILISLPNDNLKDTIDLKQSSYINHIKNTFKIMLDDTYLMLIIILTAINISVLILNFEFYQLKLKDIGFNLQYIGILYAIFMLIGGIGSKISHSVITKLGEFRTFILYLLFLIISYIIMSTSNNYFVIFIAIFIQQICFSSWNIIIEKIVLSRAPTNNVKSTMISFYSLSMNLVKVIVALSLTAVISISNYKISYIIMALITFIIMLIFTFIHKNINNSLIKESLLKTKEYNTYKDSIC